MKEEYINYICISYSKCFLVNSYFKLLMTKQLFESNLPCISCLVHDCVQNTIFIMDTWTSCCILQTRGYYRQCWLVEVGGNLSVKRSGHFYLAVKFCLNGSSTKLSFADMEVFLKLKHRIKEQILTILCI